MPTQLKTLNDTNGADKICVKYEQQALEEFKDNLIGIIMGVPYGGDVERLAKCWGEKGKVYGFDTFTGHPKHICGAGEDSFEATCMDLWYKTLGTDKLDVDYQRSELKSMGLDNATLIQGLVTKDSCKDLDHINYAFLDMDILESMESGYEAVRHKIVDGGYLLLHDINNIARLMPWYEKLKLEPQWEVVEEYNSLTGVLRKIPYDPY